VHRLACRNPKDWKDKKKLLTPHMTFHLSSW